MPKTRRSVAFVGWVVMAILTLTLLEFASHAGLTLMGFSTAAGRPDRSEFEPWGAWGVPGTVSQQSELCLNVNYRFNSYGARDVERTPRGKNRWIFLGDSFVEGNGVEESERLSNLLAALSGKEFLNFGMSGDFGPLQYLILYKDFAHKFDHDGLMVGFLPDNDFTDNDAKFWSQPSYETSWIRHRPYYVFDRYPDSLSVKYGVYGTSVPRPDFDRRPISPDEPFLDRAIDVTEDLINHQMTELEEHSSLFFLMRNLIRSAKRQLWSPLVHHDEINLSGYFTKNGEELRATKIIFRELASLVGDKPKLLVIFPRNEDIQMQRKIGMRQGPEFARFIDGLIASGWEIIDLSDSTEIRQMEDLSLGCNDHWNASTNRVAASYLKTKMVQLGVLD